jgi:hypothetical protein
MTKDDAMHFAAIDGGTHHELREAGLLPPHRPDLPAAPGGEEVERVAKAIFEANRGWAHTGHEWDTRLDAGFMERHRNMARAAIAALTPAAETAPEAGLVEALKDILNPVGALQREADAAGSQLNGMAYSIANSVSFLQDIARRALSRAGERTP